jgi:predicted nucleotide-binding protein (sugar kinase/HSP70/actin superfamily)
MWGLRQILTEAANDFAQAIGQQRRVPTVAVVGEIYVRLDPFANDNLIERLEAKGLRVWLAPLVEWLEYSNILSEKRLMAGRPISNDRPIRTGFTGLVQRVTTRVLYGICRRALGWPERTRVEDVVASGERFLHGALSGEAVLTVGGPVYEHEQGRVDGVVLVGPHECMPCKIAENRLLHVGENSGLSHLALYVSGDGIDAEAVERFAFDLWERERLGVTRNRSSGISENETPATSGVFGSYLVADSVIGG